MKNGFDAISREVDISIINSHYYLHTHNDRHEILLFLDGESEFHVEGNVYPLRPYDMVIASANELHRIFHTARHRYERSMVSIDTDFFAKNGCTEYAGIFENKLPGTVNFFSAEFIKSKGIAELIDRIAGYQNEGEILVAKGAIFELLYKIKKATDKKFGESYGSEYVRRAVEYISEHLESRLSVEEIAERLHISHEHLCRLFKKQMRISVKQYITYKRLLYARQLCRDGKNLLEASLDAGFSSYSGFYRMYVKEFGTAPSAGMKKIGEKVAFNSEKTPSLEKN